MALGGLFALVIGYFMFYGRIQGVFIGIVTLSVTLVLETFMAQTAGPQWRIGEARLNGFNGMSGHAAADAAVARRQTSCSIPDRPLYYVLLGLVVVCYLGLRILLNAPFGNVLVAIRENPHRDRDARLRRPALPDAGLRSRRRARGAVRARSIPRGGSTSPHPAWA